MSPRNKEHFEKFIAAKNKPKVISQAAPVALSPEREQQLADWKKKEDANDAVLRDWVKRLSSTRKKVVKLNEQYRDLLYKFIQEAYSVYKEAAAHELADNFFAGVRGELLRQGVKVQSNTPDASLVIRVVFGKMLQIKVSVSMAKYLLLLWLEMLPLMHLQNGLKKKP